MDNQKNLIKILETNVLQLQIVMRKRNNNLFLRAAITVIKMYTTNFYAKIMATKSPDLQLRPDEFNWQQTIEGIHHFYA